MAVKKLKAKSWIKLLIKKGMILMAIYSNKFHTKDNILDGFTYEDLIDAIKSNEAIIDKQTIEKVFNEILKEQIKNAKEMLKHNIDNILKELKRAE